MKRETRANVWFLTLFLAVSLPGAVILFKKKLDPIAPAMYLPDPVKRRLPYMSPLPVPAEIKRFVPELTGQWVAKLTSERTGDPDVLMHDRAPVISGDRALQIVSIKEAAAATEFNAVAWSPDYTPEAARYHATVECGSQSLPATVVAAEPVEVPAPVRRELVYAGYGKPPVKVTWLTVKVGAPTAGRRPLILRLTNGNGPDPSIVTIRQN